MYVSPESAAIWVAVGVLSGCAEQLLIERSGSKLAERVVEREIDKLGLRVARLHLLGVKLCLIPAAEAIRQLTYCLATFCRLGACLG